jgi:hypothetical protein
MEEIKQALIEPAATPSTPQQSKPTTVSSDSLIEKVKQAISPSMTTAPPQPRQSQAPEVSQKSYVEKAKSGFETFLLVILVASVIAIVVAYFYPKQDESDPTSKYILLGGVSGVLISGVLLWVM